MIVKADMVATLERPATLPESKSNNDDQHSSGSDQTLVPIVGERSRTISDRHNSESEELVNLSHNILLLPEAMLNPPDYHEWVDGQFIEKTGMTFKHGLGQSKLIQLWGSYILSTGQGGKVLAETLCRTTKQTRRPDVAYITQALLAEVGPFTTLEQCFPLVGEIISPDDKAETILAKAREYLDSGCQEVWLLFPENLVVMVITASQWLTFREGETVNTQIMLPGFSATVKELFD